MDGICLYVPVYTLHFIITFDVPLKDISQDFGIPIHAPHCGKLRHYGGPLAALGLTALARSCAGNVCLLERKSFSGSDQSSRPAFLYCWAKPLIMGAVIAY